MCEMMGGIMKIALISCTSRKMDSSCRASDMYLPSPRFKLAYDYAKKNADLVYILSAKHGLLYENEIIEPYNETLNGKSFDERKAWAEKVLFKLSEIHDLKQDAFLILAGRVYNEFLLSELNHVELPLEGLSMGRWIPKLRELNNESKCTRLHRLFNDMPRYDWSKIDDIPFENGIYVMFETDEYFEETNRIVRIGTHKADGRLKSRLKDHFLRRNKDGSILRKNIGLALLHKENDPFETIWALDGSKPEIRQYIIDNDLLDKMKTIEHNVSDYLKNHIAFTCIKVDTKQERLEIEEGLITTLNHSEDFYPSLNWLGLSSPKPEITDSGLWNTQGLQGRELTFDEINRIGCGDVFSVQNDTKIKPKAVIKKISVNVNSSARTSNKTNEIRLFITHLKEDAKSKGLVYIDIVSGDIHRQLKLSNKLPSVCAAMYGVMGDKDIVLKTTPSGKSSTIMIRYFL